MLSRAEAAGRLSQAGWRELRDEVLETPPTPAAMTRKLAERFGPPPAPPAPRKAERLERLAALARRLAAACEEDGAVPEALARRAADLAGDIEGLVAGTSRDWKTPRAAPAVEGAVCEVAGYVAGRAPRNSGAPVWW